MEVPGLAVAAAAVALRGATLSKSDNNKEESHSVRKVSLSRGLACPVLDLS